MRDYNQTVEGEIMPPAVATLQKVAEQLPQAAPSNREMSPKQLTIVILASVAIPGIATIVAMLTGLANGTAVALFFIVGVFATFPFSLIVGAGEFSTFITGRSFRRLVAAQEKAVDRYYGIKERELDLDKIAMEHNHTERMAEIAGNVDKSELDRWKAGVEENMQRLLTARSEPAVSVRPASFVPATVDDSAMRAAVKAWVLAQYDASGEARSLASVRMPWNGEWAGQAWCADAKRMMLDEVLTQHGTVYRMRDQYATRTMAIGAMASW